MKTRQLLDQLFEAEGPKKDVRFDPEHYKRMGFSDEEAKEQVRRAQSPKHELRTVQRHRGFSGEEPRQEANYHSQEERAVLDKAVQKPSRMDKLRARRQDSSLPRAKAMLMALPSLQGRGQS